MHQVTTVLLLLLLLLQICSKQEYEAVTHSCDQLALWGESEMSVLKGERE